LKVLILCFAFRHKRQNYSIKAAPERRSTFFMSTGLRGLKVPKTIR
jgi:hypothetical protein